MDVTEEASLNDTPSVMAEKVENNEESIETGSNDTASLAAEKIETNEASKKKAASSTPCPVVENVTINEAQAIKQAASEDKPTPVVEKVKINEDASGLATSDDTPPVIPEKNKIIEESMEQTVSVEAPSPVVKKIEINKEAVEQTVSVKPTLEEVKSETTDADPMEEIAAKHEAYLDEEMETTEAEDTHNTGKNQLVTNKYQRPKAKTERILQLYRMTDINTQSELVETVKKYLSQEIFDGLERTKVQISPKQKTAWLVFKTTELAQKAKDILDTSALCYNHSIVGNFDLATGKRLYPDGTVVEPMLRNQLADGSKPIITGIVCHVCLEPGHVKNKCPTIIEETLQLKAEKSNDNKRRKLRFMRLGRLYSDDELKRLLGVVAGEEIANDIESIKQFVTTKQHMMANVLMKTTESASKAKILLDKCRYSNIIQYKSVFVANCDSVTLEEKKIAAAAAAKTDTTTQYNRGKKCYVCGNLDHLAAVCPRKDEVNEAAMAEKKIAAAAATKTETTTQYNRSRKCYTCGNLDHLAAVCPRKDEANEAAMAGRRGNKRPIFDADESPADPKIRKTEWENGCKTLVLTNAPADRYTMTEYLKRQLNFLDPKIVESIKYIFKVPRTAGKFCVRFTTPHDARVAKDMINKFVSLNGKKIIADYDVGEDRVLWRNNKPNIEAMADRAQWKKLNMATSSPKAENSSFVENKARWEPSDSISERSFSEVNWDKTPTQGRDGNSMSQFKNDMFLNYEDKEYDTFGLKESFLQSIGVKPPLNSRIFVDCLTNLYDDESRIQNMFSHAGTVKSVTIVDRYENSLKLKVEFEHPVEAVQAISMFHDQEVYGKRLKVTMDRIFNIPKFPPPGLKAFGPGLGQHGTPVKNVKRTIDLQKAVSIIINEMNTQKNENDSVSVSSETPQLNTSQPQANTSAPAVNNDAQNALATLVSGLANPVANNPLLALGALLNPQAAQALQWLNHTNPGNNLLNTQTKVNTQPQWNQPAQAQSAPPQMVPPPVTYPQAQMTSEQNALNSWNTIQPPNAQNTSQTHLAQASTNPQNQYMQALNMYGASNYTGYNVADATNLLSYQQALNMQSQNVQGSNMQSTSSNVQAAPNMQSQAVSLNMQSQNVQASNMQGTGSNIQAAPNMQSTANIPSGSNTSAGAYEQEINMPSVSHLKSEPVKINNYDKCTVLFNYLPPSVTSPALLSKMREIGEVRSAVLAGPGRALVTFNSPADAKTCIEILHKTKVDNQVIYVKYL